MPNNPAYNAYDDAVRRITEALHHLRVVKYTDPSIYSVAVGPERLAAIIRDAPFQWAGGLPNTLWGFPIVVDDRVDLALRHEVTA